MPKAKLTSRTVDAASPRDRLFIIFDTELAGFGLRVMPSGFKSWVIEYRPVGSSRSINKKRISLGAAAVLTPTQAREMAKDVLAGIRRGVDPLATRDGDRKAATVKDLATGFLAFTKKNRKASTHDFYRRAIELHILPALGSRKAATVTRADLRRLHATLKPVIGNRVLAIVASMFAWGAKEDLIPKGLKPAAEVERNQEQGRERYLSTAELERLGKALRDAETIGLPWDVTDGPKSKHLAKPENRRTPMSPHAVAAVRLLILTGCRLREILHLRWDDVDVQRGMLHLADSKTGRKSVVLNAPALAVLADVPRLGPFVIAGQAPKRKNDAERPRSDLKKPWAAIQRAAKLDGVRLHDLRHSFASVGAGAGLGLPIVGKLLGHTQASTTQKYAHLDNDPLRKASNAIGATIAAALDGRTFAPVIPIAQERKRIRKSQG